jgi:hypothetical protein
MKMKTVRNLVLILSFIPVSFGLRADSESAVAAEQWMELYFQSLQAGDVHQIGEMLSSQLMARRSRLLESADYREELIKTYEGGTFRLLDVRPTDDGLLAITWAVDANGETLRKRTFLRDYSGAARPEPDYRIVVEEIVP